MGVPIPYLDTGVGGWRFDIITVIKTGKEERARGAGCSESGVPSALLQGSSVGRGGWQPLFPDECGTHRRPLFPREENAYGLNFYYPLPKCV